MANSELSIHRCKSIKIESYHPSNANSIRLQIVHREYSDQGSIDATIELLMFDLPTEVTDKLIATFGDPNKEPEPTHESPSPASTLEHDDEIPF